MQNPQNGIVQLSNICTNSDNEIKTDIEENKETNRIRKPSNPGERTLIKVNTPREPSHREEVKKSNRTSSRIFDEIVENPSQKKENQKLELFNNLINNNSLSNEQLKAFIFK